MTVKRVCRNADGEGRADGEIQLEWSTHPDRRVMDNG